MSMSLLHSGNDLHLMYESACFYIFTLNTDFFFVVCH